MPTLNSRYAQCRKVLCLTAKRRETITYDALGKAIGLHARIRWSYLLNPMAADEIKKTGHDLTLVAVYGSGPAKGLGRYFSNIRSGRPPGSKLLDPRNKQQVAAYKQALEQVFNCYATVQC